MVDEKLIINRKLGASQVEQMENSAVVEYSWQALIFRYPKVARLLGEEFVYCPMEKFGLAM